MENISSETDTMKAIVISKNQKIYYKEVKEPKIKKDYVKVKVKAAGLCGSDIQKILFDKKALTLQRTKILGHEISGIVCKLGKGIKKLKIGDRVVINPLIRRRNEDITKIKAIGRDLPGGFSDYIVVPYKNIKKLPKGVNFEEATLVDSIAVAIHGYHLAGSPENEDILIIGDGPLGLIIGIICLNFNNKVTIIGKNVYNLKLAKELGMYSIDHTKMKKFSHKYPIIFEAVGRKQDKTLQMAVKLIKPYGKIIVLGVFPKGFYGKIQLRDLFFKEGMIIGSNSYGYFRGKDEFEMAIKILSKLRKKFLKIITHTMPLKDFNKALKLLKDKKNSKVIKIVFNP